MQLMAAVGHVKLVAPSHVAQPHGHVVIRAAQDEARAGVAAVDT